MHMKKKNATDIGLQKVVEDTSEIFREESPQGHRIGKPFTDGSLVEGRVLVSFLYLVFMDGHDSPQPSRHLLAAERY